jgi:hypothetical protein
MRSNHLFALPLAAGLLSAASGLAGAATPIVTAIEPANLGFVAAAVAPAAAPGYVRLANEEGSRDRYDRGERDRRDPGDRPDRPERHHR